MRYMRFRTGSKESRGHSVITKIPCKHIYGRRGGPHLRREVNWRSNPCGLVESSLANGGKSGGRRGGRRGGGRGSRECAGCGFIQRPEIREFLVVLPPQHRARIYRPNGSAIQRRMHWFIGVRLRQLCHTDRSILRHILCREQRPCHHCRRYARQQPTKIIVSYTNSSLAAALQPGRSCTS